MRKTLKKLFFAVTLFAFSTPVHAYNIDTYNGRSYYSLPVIDKNSDYGIICKSLYQTRDLTSNFICKSHFNPNNYAIGEAGKILKYRMGQTDVHQFAVNGDVDIVISTDIRKEVNERIIQITKYAKKVQGQKPHMICSSRVKNIKNKTYTIDVRKNKVKEVRVNISAVLNLTKKGLVKKVNIKKNKGQTVVLTSGNKGNEIIPPISVSSGYTSKKIIFNFPYASSVALNSPNLKANVIVPKAVVKLNQSGQGFLVCSVVSYTQGDWRK